MYIYIYRNIHMYVYIYIYINIPPDRKPFPIKRTFFKKMVILPQCCADLMIGNPGKTWGAFFWLFSVIAVNDPRVNDHVATFNVVNDPRDLSSVQTCNVVNNPSDLSRVEIFHVRSTRNVNMPPHPTPPHPTSAHPTPPHPTSSVATCNVVNDPRDLSSVAIFHARSTRNVNMPPPTPPHNRDIQKRAFYGNGFRSAGINMWDDIPQWQSYLWDRFKTPISQTLGFKPGSDMNKSWFYIRKWGFGQKGSKNGCLMIKTWGHAGWVKIGDPKTSRMACWF